MTKIYADRQPEFTQIDYEMAFVEQEDVLKFSENDGAFTERYHWKRSGKFPRMTLMQDENFAETIDSDIRIGMNCAIRKRFQNI